MRELIPRGLDRSHARQPKIEFVRDHFPFGGVPLAGLPLGQVGGPLAPAARLGGQLLLVALLGGTGVVLVAGLRRRWALAQASTRAGVSGVSLTSAPIAARASRTALAIAAGGATAPPSPIPFMPYSVAEAGVCRWPILIAGNSAAPGMR